MAIANSIKHKNKIYKKFCKEKNPQQKDIYEKQFKTYRNHLTTLLRITKDKYYKNHFKENKKKLKTIRKTIKEIVNVKHSNDVQINSILIAETITANAKLIANHFNTFFTSVAAKLNEKIVKAKKHHFHIILDRLLMKLYFFPNNSSRGRISNKLHLNLIKLLASTAYQQKH